MCRGKYLQTISLIVGVVAVICLVLGSFFASQIMITSGSQSQILTTITLTTTTSALGQTVFAKCSASACTVEVNIGEQVTEVITGVASHVIPATQKQATENLKAFLDALGILFLFVAAALQLYCWKLRRDH